MKLSCMALTEPLEAPVVKVAHVTDCGMPKRTSLPSMLPPSIAHGVHERDCRRASAQ